MISNIITKLIAGLIHLLNAEAARHDSAAEHKDAKAFNHKCREDKAVAKMQEAGAAYRSSLHADVAVHSAQADKADSLAAKLAQVIE